VLNVFLIGVNYVIEVSFQSGMSKSTGVRMKTYKSQKQPGALDDLFILLEQLEKTIGITIADEGNDAVLY
jgi:hypothetical protein